MLLEVEKKRKERRMSRVNGVRNAKGKEKR